MTRSTDFWRALWVTSALTMTGNSVAAGPLLEIEPVVISADDPSYDKLRAAARVKAFRKDATAQQKRSAAINTAVIELANEQAVAEVINRKPSFIFSGRSSESRTDIGVSEARERAAAEAFTRILETKR